MNSSTSPFEPIPSGAGAARVWLRAIALAALLLFAGMTIVALVDPFNAQITSYRLRYDRWETFRRTNVTLWDAIAIDQDRAEKKEAAELVVLGDSRSQQLTGGYLANRAATVRGIKIYSLASGGASIYEQMAFLEYYRSDFRSLKTVVMTVPFTRLRPRDAVPDGAERSLKYGSFPILYLTDLYEMLRSIKWLVTADLTAKAEPSPWQRTREASVSIDQPLCEQETPITQNQIADIDRRFQRVQRDRLPIKKMIDHELRPFVEKLHSEGVEVIFYIPPWPKPIREMIEANYLKKLNQARSALSTLAPVYEVPISFSDRVGWADQNHSCYEAGMQFLDLMLESIKVEPPRVD